MKATKRITTVLTLALLGVFTSSAYTSIEGISGPTWYDCRASDFGGGSGTKEDPWVLRTAEQLALLAYYVNTDVLDLSNRYFVLGDNIDLSSRKAQADDGTYQTLSWVPIGTGGYSGNHYSFEGTLSNPNGYVIKNMIIRASGEPGVMDYGLFGHLKGHADGLRLQGVTIQGVDGDQCGAICGRADNYSVQTSITNCQVENVNIVTNSGIVGGIVGDAYHCLLKNCVVKGSLRGLFCGGVVGRYSDLDYTEGDDPLVIDNCHSVVDIRVCGADNNYRHGYAGGIAGFCIGNPHQVIQFCSASGSIATADDDRMGLNYGGLIGSLQDLNVENCCSSMSLSGANVMGGLVGCMKAPSTVLSSFANGFIDTTLHNWTMLDGSFRGVYAGGLVGYISNSDVSDGDVYLSYSMSAGSLVEPLIPDEAREYFGFGYGSVVGCANNSSDFFHTMNGLTVDKNLSGLPAIPEEYGEIVNVEYKKTKQLTSDDEPYKSFYMMPIDIMSGRSEGVAFQDNFMLAAVPFYVKDEHFAHYNVWQVTTEFNLTPLAYNRATGKALAWFYFQPGQDLSFLQVEEDAESAVKTVTPLDPGDADVIVEYEGLKRQIHLDITYGVPWNAKEPREFPGGNGARDDPYIIQNVSQLIAAAESEVFNREDMYFRLSNDLFFNTHLIQTNETVKEGASQWYPMNWKANLDGNGKSIYGLYIKTFAPSTIVKSGPGSTTASGTETVTYTKDIQAAALFGVLSGYVHDLAIVDSYVSVYSTAYSTPFYNALLCGLMTGDAKVERCMAHGIVDSNRMCGGLVGHAFDIDVEASRQALRPSNNPVTVSCGTVEDCFSCVHVEFELEYFNEHHTRRDARGTSGSGIAGSGVKRINRCVATGKVENFEFRRGVSSLATNHECDISTWYFDMQQMTEAKQSSTDRGEHTTAEMIQGDIFTGQPAWQHEKGRYPVLRQFADTPYGDLLSMPVHFADGDRAGHVTQIFEFPTEDVTWETVTGDTYVDMINECGAATPMSTGPDYIFAQTTPHSSLLTPNSSISQCTKALRVMQLDVVVPEGTVVGIQFEDPKCEAAWLTAFQKEEGDVVTLRNAYTVSSGQANVFNTHAQQNGVETFNEMRFFVGIKNLLSGMLSDISTLREVQLPKQLEYIDFEAFTGCSALTEVTLPATTQEVTGGAFDGSSVTDILVEPRCKSFEVRDHILFTTDNEHRLVAYPPARAAQTITLTGPCHSIMFHAFNKIPQLDEIYIDYPKPEGSAIELDDEAIVHWNADNGQLMDIYINDGSFDGYDANYHYETGGNLDGVLMKEYMEKHYWQAYANAGKLHRYFPLVVTNAKWATMYIGFCTQLPPELKAYIAPKSLNELYEQGETDLTLKRVNNLLHHTVPVVIKAEQAGTYLLRPYEGTVQNIPMSANKLMGTDIGQDGKYGLPVNQMDIQNEFSVLTLGYNSAGTLGFYGYTGEWIPPYKAYLYYNWLAAGTLSAGSSPAFSVVIDDTIDDLTTSLLTPHSSLLTPEVVYDLQGRKVSDGVGAESLPKGIYIINGTKVVIK